jgi:acyl-homoserine-lactone acylase
MDFRPQSSVRLLNERPATLEDLVVQANSSRMELAERIIDDLLPILRQGDGVHEQAAEVLESWDRTADAGSRGGVLFNEFWTTLARLSRGSGGPRPGESAGPFAIPWDASRPDQTPDGLRDAALVRQAMGEAAAVVGQKYGALDVAWGDVYRLRRGGLDYPGSGGPGGLGIFRVVGYAPAEEDLFQSVSGDSFMAAVEFSRNATRAFVLTTYGNSSRPDSIHYGDQLELFAQKRMRPALLSREEILARKSQIEELHHPGSR